jgi:hypothetical protein
MINFLKSIGNWLIGSADKLEALDADIRAQINAQTRRAFVYGAACGVMVSIIVARVL